MKKTTIKSIVISFIITLVGLFCNLVGYQILDMLPFSIKISGGDVISSYGFGLRMDTVYPIFTDDKPYGTVYSIVNFDIIGLCITYIIVLAITITVMVIVNKIKQGKNKQ